MTGSRPGQRRARIALGVLRAICCVALLPTGCVFDLHDVVHSSGGRGGSGNDVSQGGSGGGSSDGGATSAGAGGAAAMAGSGAGGAGGADCGAGKKRCGPDCVRTDDPAYGCAQDCAPCKGLDGTVFTCTNATCTFMGCKPGFGDCNGSEADGCEVNFDVDLPQPQGAALDPVLAHHAVRQPTMDGLADDMVWSVGAWTPIAEPCVNCKPRSPIPGVAAKGQPPRDDLSAWFRVAWDNLDLYALIEVRDDILVSKPGPYDPGMLGASVLEDSVELLISVHHSMGDYGEDDMQLYFPLDGMMSRPNQPSPTAPPNGNPENELVVMPGHGCYTMELRMAFQYMALHDNPPFSPAPDQVLGFTAAVNDWDWDDNKRADGGQVPTFQSHLFSKDPGDNYWFMTAGFGGLKLVDP